MIQHALVREQASLSDSTGVCLSVETEVPLSVETEVSLSVLTEVSLCVLTVVSLCVLTVVSLCVSIEARPRPLELRHQQGALGGRRRRFPPKRNQQACGVHGDWGPSSSRALSDAPGSTAPA